MAGAKLMSEASIRSMTLDDVEAAVHVQLAAFMDLDRRQGEQPSPVTDRQLARSRLRHQHFVTHDPDGSFVATVDGRVIGCAMACRREGLWGLSLLAVDPSTQSSGAGRKLLAAALTYADGCDRAVILSSTDPRAIRLYGTSGFDLFPQVYAVGKPDLSARPTHSRKVRDGDPRDTSFMDEVDRAVRGAGRGQDHAVMGAIGASLFCVEDSDGRGYAYVRDGAVYLLAATDDATATALIWRCFEDSVERDLKMSVDHISGEQQWAVEACFAARLKVAPQGPVFWRGTTPPRSYIPSGAFL